MSNESISLALSERTVSGKAVKQLRRDGLVPAVVHDHGQASKHVMVPYLEMVKVYQQAGKHHPLNLTLGKETYMALIKDVDFDPKKHQVRHVVFNAIKQDETVETEVPVHIEGDIPAEKLGLLIVRPLDHVEIEALPKDLIDEIKVDGAKLAELGDKLTVGDLIVPSGVTILTEAEHTLAVVEEPRVEEVVETPEETEETSAADVPSEHGAAEPETAAEEEK